MTNVTNDFELFIQFLNIPNLMGIALAILVFVSILKIVLHTYFAFHKTRTQTAKPTE